MEPKLQMRKTRIVCVSDTHNQTPTLPKGDILIHAGDFTNQGTYSELLRQTKWLAKADFEAKIIVAGNHDITLDGKFYAKEGAPGGRFHRQQGQEQDVDVNRALLKDCPGVTYLCHEEAHIVLEGLGVHFNVFGSPYSLEQGAWAFGYSPEEAEPLWAKVPEHIDLLITHGPPKGLCDASKDGGEGGCPALRQTLDRVRPRLLVCGHRHEGRGCRVLHWDNSIHDTAQNPRISKWLDPGEGTGRLSLVDLTGRKGKDAWVEDITPDTRLESSHYDNLVSPTKGVVEEWSKAGSCVVNAAIMAHSYGGPKHFNKPMVVDLYLPIWNAGLNKAVAKPHLWAVQG